MNVLGQHLLDQRFSAASSGFFFIWKQKLKNGKSISQTAFHQELPFDARIWIWFESEVQFKFHPGKESKKERERERERGKNTKYEASESESSISSQFNNGNVPGKKKHWKKTIDRAVAFFSCIRSSGINVFFTMPIPNIWRSCSQARHAHRILCQMTISMGCSGCWIALTLFVNRNIAVKLIKAAAFQNISSSFSLKASRVLVSTYAFEVQKLNGILSQIPVWFCLCGVMRTWKFWLAWNYTYKHLPLNPNKLHQAKFFQMKEKLSAQNCVVEIEI